MSNEGAAPLIQSREGTIARIHFNRPAALNAVDGATAAAFEEACQSIASDPEVRALIISGEGRAFVAGGDVRDFAADPGALVERLIEPMHRGVMHLSRMQAPIIASVQGAAAGAGLSLAMICDLVIAASDARFSFAYLKLGATSDLGASWSLPRIVGWRKATEIALLGETIDAAEALRLGLVNRVVEPAALKTETDRIATQIAERSPVAVANMKHLLRSSLDCSLSEQLDAEKASFQRCVRSEEFNAAVRAFVGRSPKK